MLTSPLYSSGNRLTCTRWATYRENVIADEQTDFELTRSVAGGDQAAFGILYDRYGDKLAAICSRLVGAERATDVVHDVYLELWERALEFDPERGSMLTWLVVRARSRCIDTIRKSKRRAELLQEHGEMTRPREITPPSERAVERSQLREAIANLEPDLMKVIELAYFQGASSTEISESLDIPVGTVKSRMRRAQEQLALSFVEGGV